jgi:PPOX class probable F420-dependent enzyme
MRKGLRPEELGDLLDRPLLAVLVTRRAKGELLLSPVWHEWSDGGFSVFTDSTDVKVRHLERDPRAAIEVFESELPYRGIEVRCEAAIDRRPDPDVLRRIATRYVTPEEAERYVDDGSVLIRLVPGELRTWDFVDDYPESVGT